MNRRNALQRVAFLMGGAISAPTMIAMLEGCKSNTASEAATNVATAFTTEQKSLVSEIAEMIIPKTSTPGAKDAKVGEFIEMMLKDCYSAIQREHFAKGLTEVDEASKKANGKSFVESTNEQRTAILKQTEQAAKDEANKNASAVKIKDSETGATKDLKGKNETPTPFFRLMKELTLFGYFTSEEGATKALAYVAVPGAYKGCIKLEKGQKVWALN